MARTLKTYTVHISSKYPIAGERPSDVDFDAYTAKDAVRLARKYMESMGNTRRDGPFVYRAVLSS